MKSTYELIIAGFGGQGVLLLGQILAYAAVSEGKEVSWMPSYGPEMRGGTANCIVIISDQHISSPLVSTFDAAILLSQPALDKFERAIRPQGLLVYEQSTIIRPPLRNDLEVLCIPGIVEAEKLMSKQVANMVLLGAFLEKLPIVKSEHILVALRSVLPSHRQHLIDSNERALVRGKEIARAWSLVK
ncbi:MAG: 2-oxoacid:acceptor oxidoreductase family protein [Bacteroidetes bacterium]|nr:2-oxoacid:acceptor oxidoreductase family protein [Bacteroidota bacterium]